MPPSVAPKKKPKRGQEPRVQLLREAEPNINDYFENDLLYRIFCIDVTVAHKYLCLALVTKKWHASLAPRKQHFRNMEKMHDVFRQCSAEFERYLRIYDYTFFVQCITPLLTNAWPDDLEHLQMYDLPAFGTYNAKPLQRFCMFLATSEDIENLYGGTGQLTYSFWCERYVSLLARYGLHKQLNFFFEHYEVPVIVKNETYPGACVEAISGVKQQYNRTFFECITEANDVKNKDELKAFIKESRDASFDTLKVLIVEGFRYGSTSCAAAAENGDLEILKFLKEGVIHTPEREYEVKCHMDSQTITRAVYNGHSEVWKYARNVYVCPFDTTALVAAASRSNNQGWQDLKDLLACECEYDTEVSEAAARNRNLEILQFLHDRGYDLSDDIPRIATTYNCGNVLGWCKNKHEFDGHINQALVQTAIEFNAVWTFSLLMEWGYEFEHNAIDDVIANKDFYMVKAIDGKTNIKWTSDHLMMAVKSKCFEIFEYLQKKVLNWYLISDKLLDIASKYDDKTLYQYIRDERWK